MFLDELGIFIDVGTYLIEVFNFIPIVVEYVFRGVLEILFLGFQEYFP